MISLDAERQVIVLDLLEADRQNELKGEILRIMYSNKPTIYVDIPISVVIYNLPSADELAEICVIERSRFAEMFFDADYVIGSGAVSYRLPELESTP